MLRQILFLLNQKTLENKELRGQVQSAVGYIMECGYEAHVSAIGDNSFDGRKKIEKESALIVTDNGEMSEGLLENGFFVVGYIHDLNANEKFEGTKYVFTGIDQVDIDSYVKSYQRYTGEPWEILMTNRLLIRETTVEDVDVFYELYKDTEMTKYMEGLFENPEDEKRYQRDYIKKVYGFYGFGVWTIIRREDGRIIGRAGYSMRNGFDQIELGFLIGKEFQNQGYAFEACKAILEYGKRVLMLEHVQTLVKKDNAVSRHLCEKLGFKEVGVTNVEENIYGRSYSGEDSVRLSESKYGEYIQYSLDF